MVYQEEGFGPEPLNGSSSGGQQGGKGTVRSICVRGARENHKTIRQKLEKHFKIVRSFNPLDEELKRYIVFEIASKNGKPINSETIKYLNRSESLVVTCREDGGGGLFDPFATPMDRD